MIEESAPQTLRGLSYSWLQATSLQAHSSVLQEGRARHVSVRSRVRLTPYRTLRKQILKELFGHIHANEHNACMKQGTVTFVSGLCFLVDEHDVYIP